MNPAGSAYLVGAFDPTATIGLVLSVILGGGLIAAVATFIKARPEAGQITVVASEKVVVLQQGYIEKQEKRLADLEAKLGTVVNEYEERIAGLLEEKRLLENDRAVLRVDLAHAVADRDAANAKVTELTGKVEQLETRVAEIETNGGGNGHAKEAP